MPALPMHGVRVVALEHAIAAPLCTRQLAALGASVIKVEPPTGDFGRRYDDAVRGESAHFVWLNGGKRSIAVDLKDPVGIEVLHRLLARCDVLVSNLAPASRERLVPDEQLQSTHPELIRCYISGYGTSGPYADRKAYDALIQGETGLITSTGTATHPAKAGISVADVGAGVYSFALIGAALLDRERTGRGARLDVSLFDVLSYWLGPQLLSERNGTPAPPPAGGRHSMIVPYGLYRTRDGHAVNIAVQNDDQWIRLCQVALDRPDLAEDHAWASNAERTRGRHLLEPMLEAEIGRFDLPELTRRLDRADVPWGHLRSIADAASHPQLDHRRRWQTVRLGGGTAEAMVEPFEIDGEVAALGPVPALGEHSIEVMTEIGYSDREIAHLLSSRAVKNHDPTGRS